MNTLTYEEVIAGKNIIRFRNDEEIDEILRFNPEEKPDVTYEELPVPSGIVSMETPAGFPDKVVRFSINADDTITVELMWRTLQTKFHGKRSLDDPCVIRAHATVDMLAGDVKHIEFDHDFTDLLKQRQALNDPAYQKALSQSPLFKEKDDMTEFLVHTKRITSLTIPEIQRERVQAFKYVARVALMANLYILFGERPGNRRVRHHISKKGARHRDRTNMRSVKMAKAVFELGSTIARPKSEPPTDQQEEVEKRTYRKPEHEILVRGHWREYKSGKRVYIAPVIRNKGKAGGPSKYFNM